MAKRDMRNNESLMETLDTLADPKAVEGIRKGQEDIRKGRTRSWKEIKKSLERGRH